MKKKLIIEIILIIIVAILVFTGIYFMLPYLINQTQFNLFIIGLVLIGSAIGIGLVSTIFDIF